MSLYQTPPDSLTIDGRSYPVDTDFRAWMEFQKVMTARRTDEERAEDLCALMDRMGLPPGEAALEAMLAFYTAESKEKAVAGQKDKPACFDFEADSEFIFSEFLRAYGIDLTTAHMHWWKWKALFKSLPDDCQFCKIMQYRTIDMKDVPKGQRCFYAEQKARYSLGSAAVHRTEQDMRDYVQRRFEEAKRQSGKEAQRGK